MPQKTSRHYIIDAIEMIANDIANASHYQELLNGDADITEEEEKTIESLLMTCVARRRNLMNMIREEFDVGKTPYWCSLKHAIASYMYATEIYYAAPSDKTKGIQQEVYEDMIIVLSLFLKQEINVCGRCLMDALSSNKNE